ncbi:hypothetical protein M426DRAFT_229624 [Hypoxylon sp. CI-4A]|nr:hypothetical protein M426DRAFT_229624 [Hypoxylon sp. CI-4A]
MTTLVSGSSLPQARDVHQHNHFHNSRDSHRRHQHIHNNNHHHVRSQTRSSSNSSKRRHKRTDSEEPTIIVETVSVLQLIDSSGAPITLQTLSPSQSPLTPTTPAISSSASASSSNSSSTGVDSTTVDPATETVSGSSYSSSSSSSSSSSATSDDDGDSLSSTSIPTIDPTVAPSESSMPTSFPTLSYSPLTSTPLSGSPAFPSLAGVTNTTQVSSSTIVPTSSDAFSVLSFSAESVNSSSTSTSSSSSSISSSTTSSSSSPSFSSSSSATTTSHSQFSSTSSGSYYGTATSTGTGESGLGFGGNAEPSSTSTSTADAGTSSSTGTPASTVAGSVLGGVAALAFILILALFLVRWKKRRNTKGLLQGSTSERGTGGTLVGNSGPGGGGGGGGGMGETQRSIPFAIPGALASLTGYKRFSGRSGASSDGGERGFSKVSGRKLPSVIQYGGDGYTDPRDTILSDQSIEYRDSMAFPGLASMGPRRLAVGTPMRPESGVPVFNAGPARTPVTEAGPFAPYSDNSPLEPPPRDPLGRSHPSHDGSSRSHGSNSRFSELL